jgi:hypothetical protein
LLAVSRSAVMVSTRSAIPKDPATTAVAMTHHVSCTANHAYYKGCSTLWHSHMKQLNGFDIM